MGRSLKRFTSSRADVVVLRRMEILERFSQVLGMPEVEYEDCAAGSLEMPGVEAVL